MFSRRALWLTLAITAILVSTNGAFAQPAKGTSVPIIPVSLKNEQVAATVNGEKILVGEVRQVLDGQPYPVSLTEAQKKEMRKAAVNTLIDDAIMRQYLTKNVGQVNQADFNKEVQELQEALKKQKKSLPEFLKEANQSEDQLRRDIVSRLQWKALLQRACNDDKAKAYYDANKLFFDKVMVKANHILIKLPANPSREQRDKAVQQLLVWRQEILAGKVRFEDVAKQYSDCPSKAKGGALEQFRYKFDMVPEFSKAAFSLKANEISEVVQTVFGVHLIWVRERTPGEASNFAALKETVRDVWCQEEDLFGRILAEQRGKSEIKVDLP